MGRISLIACIVGLSVALITAQNVSFAERCMSFNPLQHGSRFTVNAHQYLPAGTLLSLPDYGCGPIKQNVSTNTCRIALNISTSMRSGVIYEGWFPENWSGRFMTTGNGGIDGCIKYDDINYGLLNGFSTVGSNNGHNSTSGLAFYHNDEVLKDYVYRSLHTITETGKKLTTAFYSTKPKKSYYLGCSGGGRQGVHAAEAYPDDFDGIVVGAPASNFNNMTSWRATFFGKTGVSNSTSFLNAATWSGLIHNEVLRQCDTIDGVQDGIIENPVLCDFRPEALLCSSKIQNHTSCLTKAQVEIVRSIYSPLYGSSGELVYPAMQPGSEIAASTGFYGGVDMWPYSFDWFRYVVYSNPAWKGTNLGVADYTAAQALNPFHVQTFPNSLEPFTTRGKMLIYHGQQDNQITSFASERLYNNLAAHTPYAELDEQIRFFRISGMSHCSGGPGAWMIGQSLEGFANTFDPESNVLAALVHWVEEGRKPETILGTKFVNDTVGGVVQRSRRHCRYPYVNTYVGGGVNASLPEAWECVFR